jgi:hypothetical protein
MILGLSLPVFTVLHVIISLIGLVSGIIMLVAMLRGQPAGGWTALYLLTTVLTSASGFLFHADHLLPSHVLGIISIVVLAVALLGLYVFHLAGPWRPIYVVAAVLALYLNTFVAVVQAFAKVPFLTPLAPTQSEPPFVVAQIAVLVVFVVLGIAAVRAFHPAGGGARTA